MGVDIKIIATTFPAIMLVLGVLLYAGGSQAFGFLLVFMAIVIFLAELVLKHEDML
jgi:hypothetical protein